MYQVDVPGKLLLTVRPFEGFDAVQTADDSIRFVTDEHSFSAEFARTAQTKSA